MLVIYTILEKTPFFLISLINETLMWEPPHQRQDASAILVTL